jgi:CheY-like chemotaxis protein
MMAKTKSFDILLAEDNSGDAELVRMALIEHDVDCTLRVICDGAQAITLLESLDTDPTTQALDLLLVDMNLPKRSGEDILKCLRSTRSCAKTPVIIMSGSAAGLVEEEATRHPAMIYFKKPSTLDEFMQLGSIVRNVLEKNSEVRNDCK